MAEITLFGDIGGQFWEGITARDISQQLAMAGEADPLTVRINSKGGDVFEGVTIFNLLNSREGPVNVRVEGEAASIASVIAMAGDTVTMGTSAMMFVHNPHTGMLGFGDAAFFEGEFTVALSDTVSRLRKVKEAILDAYGERDINRVMASTWMDEERFFSGPEAVEAGLADIAEGSAASASDKRRAAAARLEWEFQAQQRGRKIQLRTQRDSIEAARRKHGI